MTVLGSSKNDSPVIAGGSLGRRPLLWLNLVCLDAPLVALVWQLAFARAFQTAPRSTECVALFLTAWSIYLTDRFIDSSTLSADVPRSARAQFCLRHRKPWAALILMVVIFDVAVILVAVPPRTIVRGAVLGAGAIVYLAINFAFSRWWRSVPIKEFVVGFVFAAGTVLVPGSPPWTDIFLVAATLFGCVCWLNCLSIALWERTLDQNQGRHSFATDRGGAEIYVRLFGLVLACCAAAFGFANPAARPLVACLVTSTALLLGLQFPNVARDERTALADLVLLTPLLLLLAERAR